MLEDDLTYFKYFQCTLIEDSHSPEKTKFTKQILQPRGALTNSITGVTDIRLSENLFAIQIKVWQMSNVHVLTALCRLRNFDILSNGVVILSDMIIYALLG